jgi:hypothetical protein
MMVGCPQCGTRYAAHMKFCPKCSTDRPMVGDPVRADLPRHKPIEIVPEAQRIPMLIDALRKCQELGLLGARFSHGHAFRALSANRQRGLVDRLNADFVDDRIRVIGHLLHRCAGTFAVYEREDGRTWWRLLPAKRAA